jgi:hypothetical protein
MKAANIVHLACHGIQDDRDATRSGFCMGDGRLTISKLMDMKLDGAFLAFLSACETAKGDDTQPDQVMHLAAAMLFTDFKTVIATMWYVATTHRLWQDVVLIQYRSISDEDGPKVAKWIYQELFAADTLDADTVAYALDTAISKLRKEPKMTVERWTPFMHMGT